MHTAKLVGAGHDHIVREVSRLLTDNAYYESMAQAHNPYGDGKATEKILAAIDACFGRGGFGKTGADPLGNLCTAEIQST